MIEEILLVDSGLTPEIMYAGASIEGGHGALSKPSSSIDVIHLIPIVTLPVGKRQSTKLGVVKTT